MDNEIECIICLEKINQNNNSAITPCGHKFCFNCILQSIQTLNTCPYCREILINISDNNENNMENIDDLNSIERIAKYIIRITTDGFSIKELFYITSFLLINNYFYIYIINNKVDFINIMYKKCYMDDFTYNYTMI